MENNLSVVECFSNETTIGHITIEYCQPSVAHLRGSDVARRDENMQATVHSFNTKPINSPRKIVKHPCLNKWVLYKWSLVYSNFHCTTHRWTPTAWQSCSLVTGDVIVMTSLLNFNRKYVSTLPTLDVAKFC